MNKITCDIIRDLLPSYTDGIASADSVKLVKEHLAECAECRAFKSRMEEPGLDIRKENTKLDYMKKIRRMTDLKSALCILFIIIIVVIFSEYTKSNYQPRLFFGLVPVLLIFNYILFFNTGKPSSVNRIKSLIPNAVSIILTLYIMLLMLVLTNNWIKNNNLPFNMDYARLGPFCYYQLVFTMIAEIIIWLREIICHIKKAHFSIITGSLGIIGFYMSLYYMQMLKTLASLEEFTAICHTSVMIFAEGAVITILLFIIEKLRHN